jgi:hypothetical protein
MVHRLHCSRLHQIGRSRLSERRSCGRPDGYSISKWKRHSTASSCQFTDFAEWRREIECGGERCPTGRAHLKDLAAMFRGAHAALLRPAAPETVRPWPVGRAADSVRNKSVPTCQTGSTIRPRRRPATFRPDRTRRKWRRLDARLRGRSSHRLRRR